MPICFGFDETLTMVYHSLVVDPSVHDDLCGSDRFLLSFNWMILWKPIVQRTGNFTRSTDSYSKNTLTKKFENPLDFIKKYTEALICIAKKCILQVPRELKKPPLFTEETSE